MGKFMKQSKPKVIKPIASKSHTNYRSVSHQQNCGPVQIGMCAANEVQLLAECREQIKNPVPLLVLLQVDLIALLCVMNSGVTELF